MTTDIFEFIYGYTVPRCKQRNKSGKTLSEHGTDIIAYKFEKTDRKLSERMNNIEDGFTLSYEENKSRRFLFAKLNLKLKNQFA